MDVSKELKSIVRSLIDVYKVNNSLVYFMIVNPLPPNKRKSKQGPDYTVLSKCKTNSITSIKSS